MKYRKPIPTGVTGKKNIAKYNYKFKDSYLCPYCKEKFRLWATCHNHMVKNHRNQAKEEMENE